MLGISDAAESIGFRTAGVKITWEQLRDEANLPCIVHWNQRHFVVVYKIAKTKRKLFSGNREFKGYEVYVSDPAEGSAQI
jgi:ATP-binding cassette subfamily B protein